MRRRYMRASAVLIAGALLALAGRTAAADDVPVLHGDQVTAGAMGRQSITPPGPEFTNVSALNSDPGAVQVDQPNRAAGGWGVDFTIGKNAGVAVVTVTWENPKTHETRYQFFVVACKQDVQDVRTITVEEGGTIHLDPGDLDPYPSGAPQGVEPLDVTHPPQTTASATVKHYTVGEDLEIQGNAPGTAVFFANRYTDPHDHTSDVISRRVIIVTITPKHKPASSPSTTPGSPQPPHDDHGGGGD
ncbi:MAG: hypothetical protein ACYDAB_00615 [bacterium]